jgi:hypothetical protein
LNLPVRAGLRVSGDAKNWENPGSWALAGSVNNKLRTAMRRRPGVGRMDLVFRKAFCFINSWVSRYQMVCRVLVEVLRGIEGVFDGYTV